MRFWTVWATGERESQPLKDAPYSESAALWVQSCKCRQMGWYNANLTSKRELLRVEGERGSEESRNA
jgi:hypothetical protein